MPVIAEKKFAEDEEEKKEDKDELQMKLD